LIRLNIKGKLEVNGKTILLDTNIVLYLIGGKIKYSNLPGGKYCISVITELELLSFPKLTKTESNKILQFLKEIDIVDINNTIKKETVSFRRKYSVKLPDAIICATAKYLKAILFTCDKNLIKINEIEIYDNGCSSISHL